MMSLGKFLILFGTIAIIAGFLLLNVSPFRFLGRLPGDIRIEHSNFSFYFPITTCVLISITLTLIYYFVSKWK